jgi:hypothetical protein
VRVGEVGISGDVLRKEEEDLMQTTVSGNCIGTCISIYLE